MRTHASRKRDWKAIKAEVLRLYNEKQWSATKIAIHKQIGAKTVHRIVNGQFDDPKPTIEGGLDPIEVEPYWCDGCERRTGRRRLVCLSPCVICAAENHKRAMGVPE